MENINYPKQIYSGKWSTGHVQGIAIDKRREYMYYSFTTSLVKTDVHGNVIGSVTGLAGHLGCIAFNYEDGHVYGSLEYKHDQIGQGILDRYTDNAQVEDGFYIAVFDVEKINRVGMDAESDGVMKAVYLKEVVKDFSAENHRYGCSGIDGTTFGPAIDENNGKNYLYVAYGIYGDVSRTDNDYQVILRYDISDWEKHCKPLNQKHMHHSGPISPDDKYFLFTGNTTYGIQNIEYDSYTKKFLVAVYVGEKKQYPNYPFFTIDALRKPEEQLLKGFNDCEEKGKVIFLSDDGILDKSSNIYGWNFKYGATGMIALGDGYYYFSHNREAKNDAETTVKLYKWDGINPFCLVE